MSGGLPSTNVSRWINHVPVITFVDQDTFVQRKLVSCVCKIQSFCMPSLLAGITFVCPVPRKTALSNIQQFWDAIVAPLGTVARCPNRISHLSKEDESGAFLLMPSREMIMERETQNFDLSTDSVDQSYYYNSFLGRSKIICSFQCLTTYIVLPITDNFSSMPIYVVMADLRDCFASKRKLFTSFTAT